MFVSIGACFNVSKSKITGRFLTYENGSKWRCCINGTFSNYSTKNEDSDVLFIYSDRVKLYRLIMFGCYFLASNE